VAAERRRRTQRGGDGDARRREDDQDRGDLDHRRNAVTASHLADEVRREPIVHQAAAGKA